MILKLTTLLIRVGISLEKRLKKLMDFFPSFGINAIAYAGAFDIALYDSGIFQLPQVLRNGGLRQTDFSDQSTADATLGFDDFLQNSNPCRMRQSLSQTRQIVLLFCEYF